MGGVQVYAVAPLVYMLDPDAVPIGFRIDVVHMVGDVRVPHKLGDITLAVDDVVCAGGPVAKGVNGGTFVLRRSAVLFPIAGSRNFQGITAGRSGIPAVPYL